MQRRIEMGLLGVLLIILIVVYFHGRDAGSGLSGVQDSNMDFIPLNVQEPELRLDLLEKIQKSTYAGSHRNVFVFGPPPAEVRVETPAERHAMEMAQIIGPRYVPPPPVNVPAQFFGTAFMEESHKRVAFFQNGDDVLVVPEGDTFLNRFRLIHIGNESADVEEISSGKHAQVPMVPPVTNPTPGQPSPPPQESE